MFKTKRLCSCGEPALTGIKYCRKCKNNLIQKMKDDGYLQPAPVGHAGDTRTTDQRENVRETKYGDGH